MLITSVTSFIRGPPAAVPEGRHLLGLLLGLVFSLLLRHARGLARRNPVAPATPHTISVRRVVPLPKPPGPSETDFSLITTSALAEEDNRSARIRAGSHSRGERRPDAMQPRHPLHESSSEGVQQALSPQGHHLSRGPGARGSGALRAVDPAGSGPPGMPLRLGGAGAPVAPARHDEEQVPEAVQVAHQARARPARPGAGPRSGARPGGRPPARRAARAPSAEPPGSTKLVSGANSVSSRSIQRSSAATSSSQMRSSFAGRSGVTAASSAPTWKSLDWIVASSAASQPSRSRVRTTPSTAFNSSTLPQASTRAASLKTRPGPSSPVVPSSPVRV